jgi:hypothetical protein
MSGISQSGSYGDGGLATRAQLAYPRGFALNASGTLYFADVFSHHARKINPDGTIGRWRGNGQPGYSGRGPATSALYCPQGVAVDPTMGNLYIADSSNYRIRMVTPKAPSVRWPELGQIGVSGDGRPARDAQLAARLARPWIRRATSTFQIRLFVCQMAPAC